MFHPQGLLALGLVLPPIDTDYENGMRLLQRVWVAKFDVDDTNKKLAARLVLAPFELKCHLKKKTTKQLIFANPW